MGEAAKRVIAATGAEISYDTHDINEYSSDGDIAKAISSIQYNRNCIQGFIGAPMEKPNVNRNLSLQMTMNKGMNAFAKVSHIHKFDGFDGQKFDFIVIRESSEGEYSAEEHEAVPGVVESLKITTRDCSERIARFAFEFALQNNREKVTCVHKANIMKQGDGLFMRTFEAVAKDYPSLESETMIVDNTCMQLVNKPSQFDVMVMPNQYGNIILNLSAGLMGGTGLCSGSLHSNSVSCYGPGARYTYSSADPNTANPTAMFMSAGNMLRNLGLNEMGISIRQSVRSVIAEGQTLTADIGGNSSTDAFTDA